MRLNSIAECVQECLLSGRMSHAVAGASRGFRVNLSAASSKGQPGPQLSVAFDACFYRLPDDTTPTPYVGSIDLTSELSASRHPGLHRVPTRGVVQAIVYNPERTGIKLFLVGYDLRDMPPNTQYVQRFGSVLSLMHCSTFIRQRTVVQALRGADGQLTPVARALRYLIHLRFVCTKPGHVYLHKSIQLVFAHRLPDDHEKLETVTDGPTNPRFWPCSPQRQQDLVPRSRPLESPLRRTLSGRSQLSVSFGSASSFQPRPRECSSRDGGAEIGAHPATTPTM